MRHKCEFVCATCLRECVCVFACKCTYVHVCACVCGGGVGGSEMRVSSCMHFRPPLSPPDTKKNSLRHLPLVPVVQLLATATLDAVAARVAAAPRGVDEILKR